MPEMRTLKLPGYNEAFEIVDARARERLDGHDTAIQTLQGSIPDTSGFITRTVSDLENYYLKSKTYSRDEIDQRISAIPKFAISVVSFLPTSNISTTTVYLVSGGSGSDLYTEYIYVNGAWEILGSQRIDLTGYATQTWTLEQLSIYALKSDIPSVPVQSVNGKTGAVNLTASDVGALTEEAVEDVLAQAKASGEFDGADGATFTPHVSADGVLSWTNDKGLANPDPVKVKGDAGYSPIRGTDYWTDEDIASIKAYVDEAILGGAW